MTFTAGFDSAEYRQKTIINDRPHVTRGLIGIGIRTSDPAKYSTAYKDAISQVFKQYKLKQERTAYCAAELSAILGPKTLNKEKEALESILKHLLPGIDEVHLFYTFLFNFETVTIYGDDPEGFKRIPVVSNSATKPDKHKEEEEKTQDFYDLISPSYPMLCAWRYSRDRSKDTLLIDAFQGQISPAWNEFSQTTTPHIYYNGDRCNPLISTADLLTRLVKLRMLEKHARFLEHEMNSVLPETGKKFNKHFLGSIYLRKMVPHKRTRFNPNTLTKHPCTFIVNENPKDESEKEMIQSTPEFNRLLKKAYDNDGCLKFFHKSNDTRIIQAKDTVFTYGKKGEETSQKLRKLGVEFIHDAKS